MQRITTVLFAIVFTNVVSVFESRAQSSDTYRLYYLGGQSNMEGMGKNRELPQDLINPFTDVMIFQGNPTPDGDISGGKGRWEILRPGHGYGFSSDGTINTLSKRFGPELAFARRMKELYPNEKIAIVKYARAGASIDSLAATDWGCWEPDYKAKGGINQYDHFLKTVAEATAVNDINGDGKPDTLVPSGILWMQGEADASFDAAIANRYEANLKHLMDLIRQALHGHDLPVVIGKISDAGNASGKVWKHGEVVQLAQEQYVKTDRNAAIVRSTSGYQYSDKYHYNSAAYLDLGKQFADALSGLRKK